METTPIAETLQAQERMLLLAQLAESPHNPRRRYDPKRLAELADSIAQLGIAQALLVRPIPGGNPPYQIIAGSRRYRAAAMVALNKGGSDHFQVPCRVLENCTDAMALELMTIENGQREDVHPLEEAAGYQNLIELAKYDVATVARKVGKSENYVTRRLSLLRLIPGVQKLFLDEKQFSFAHAQRVARLEPTDQKRALEFWNEHTRDADDPQFPTAADLNDWIHRDVLLDLATAPFPIHDAGLVKKAGACDSCPKRSGAAPALFPDVQQGDACLDGRCFATKQTAFVARREKELKAEGHTLLKISTSYGTAPPGVLPHRQYERIEHENGKCKFAEEAVYVDGHRQGALVSICRAEDCAKHHPKYESGRGHQKTNQSRLEERKVELTRAIEQHYPRALAKAVHAKIVQAGSTTLPVVDLRLVAHALFDGFDHEHRKEVARDVFGFQPIKPEKRKYGLSLPDWDKPVHTAIESWKAPQLLGFVAALAGEHFKRSSNPIERWGSSSERKPTLLEVLAQRYRIRPKAVRAAVKAAQTVIFSRRIKRLEKMIANEGAKTGKRKAAAKQLPATA